MAAGVAVSGSTVYVADAGNNMIRVVSGGSVSTLAGTQTPGSANGTGAAARFNYPFSIAIDPTTNNLIVADLNNGSVRRVTTAGVTTTVLTGLINPHGVAVDSVGRIIVTDTGNHRIMQIPAGGTASVLAGSGVAGDLQQPSRETSALDPLARR